MYKWKFHQFVSPAGRKAIVDWRSGDLSPGNERADLDNFLKSMAKLDKWEYPDIGPLKGKPNKGLTELRWRSGKVPHRLIGYQIGEHEYVFLIGCTHNAKKYNPPSALETARKRRDSLKNKEATICEYQLTTDS